MFPAPNPLPWQPYPAAPIPRSSPRRVYLARRQWLSPQLLRIWLTGRAHPESPNSLADFPSHALGCHVKLLLPTPAQTQLTLPHWSDTGAVWPAAELRPISRTFTLAAWDPQRQQVAIDIAMPSEKPMHSQPGPAAHFARYAPLGSPLGLAGPGGPVLANLAARHWYLFADLTGLALVRALLAMKPPQLQARAFIHLPANSQTLALPGVHWCIGSGQPLLQQAEQLGALNLAHSWVVLACEHTDWRALEHHWLRSRALPRQRLYSLPYWRAEQSEEHFHHERHQALDAIPAAHWHTPTEAQT